MADRSKIEWTDATWNVLRGCTRVSEGCRNCYAEGIAARFSDPGAPFHGIAERTSKGARWTGKVAFAEHLLDQPLRWRRPRRIFVNSMSDVFHESVPDEWLDRIFAVMALAPQHTFQLLTKRPERARAYFARDEDGFMPAEARIEHRSKRIARERGAPVPVGKTLTGTMPWPHVWLGTSVEDQATADTRIPALLATPARVRFISAEPLLGPLQIEPWLNPHKVCEGCDDGEGYGNHCGRTDIPRNEQCPWGRAVQIVVEHGPYDASGCPAAITSETQTLDLVIAGGESGPGARPAHPDWFRSLRDQCLAAGVAYFFKQWGEWAPTDLPSEMQESEEIAGRWNGTSQRLGKSRAGRLLDGRTWDQMPADVQRD